MKLINKKYLISIDLKNKYLFIGKPISCINLYFITMNFFDCVDNMDISYNPPIMASCSCKCRVYNDWKVFLDIDKKYFEIYFDESILTDEHFQRIKNNENIL